MFLNNLNYINIINKKVDYYIYSNEYNSTLNKLMRQYDVDTSKKYFLHNNYIFSKLVSACTKKGNYKMAYLQVVLAFKLIKQFFRAKPISLLKKAVVQVQTYIFLHKIPRGKKIRYFPRILPLSTRIHNALSIIVKLAFENSTFYRHFYISLAHAIIDNTMPNNIYAAQTKEITAIAAQNKRSIKHRKIKGKKIFTKIKRRERFKLFKKIKMSSL